MEKKPASETNPTPAPSAPAAPKKTLLAFLFSPQTRLGRIDRALSRFLAVTLGLFALGLAVGYWALYQPAQRQIGQLQTALNGAHQTGVQLNTDLDEASLQAAMLSAKNQDLQNALDIANRHIQVLQLLNQTRAARQALSAHDASTARNILLDSRNTLIKIAPQIDAYKNGLSTNMQASYDLALGKLDSDPTSAGSYLEMMLNSLVEMEKATFQ